MKTRKFNSYDKIGIVGMNPTIDKVYEIENFSAGHVFRPHTEYSVSGGKGVNIARTLKILGKKNQLLFLLGGTTGKKIKEDLKRESLKTHIVKIAGSSRVCTLVLDPITHKQTVINEIGPKVSFNEIKKVKTAFNEFIKNKQIIILSGTTPAGIKNDIYAEFIRICHRQRIPVILDTSGEKFKVGLSKKPFMIKPNLTELEYILDRRLTSLEQIKKVSRNLVRSGIEIVAVSLGEKGVLLTSRNGSWRAVPPRVKVVNSVGSGDAFVAGFAYAWTKEKDPIKALRLGVSAGTANTLTVKPGHCDKKDIERFYKQIKIEKIN